MRTGPSSASVMEAERNARKFSTSTSSRRTRHVWHGTKALEAQQ
jgi:hypothetical protein